MLALGSTHRWLAYGVQKGKTQYRPSGTSGTVTLRSFDDRSMNRIEYMVSALGRTTPTAPGSFGSEEGMLMLGLSGRPAASKGLAISPKAHRGKPYYRVLVNYRFCDDVPANHEGEGKGFLSAIIWAWCWCCGRQPKENADHCNWRGFHREWATVSD